MEPLKIESQLSCTGYLLLNELTINVLCFVLNVFTALRLTI